MYIAPATVAGEHKMIQDPQPSVGYKYRDVLVPPKAFDHQVLKQLAPLSYVAQFAIRDFKYLSNTNTTTVTITDPEIMSGVTPGNIQLNFADLGT